VNRLLHPILGCFIVHALLGSAAPDSTAQTPPPPRSYFPTSSVATSDDAFSLNFNPAGLATKRGFQAFYTHSYYSDSTFKGDDALTLAIRGLAFQVEWMGYGQAADWRRYTLALGTQMCPYFYWGTAYSWFGSKDRDLDKLKLWDFAFMTRPWKFLSIGGKVSNFNRPHFFGERIDRTWDLGIALRPFGERYTFALDGRWQEPEGFGRGRPIAHLFAQPIEGLILSGMLDDRDNYGFNVELNLHHVGAGVYSLFNTEEDQEFRGGCSYLRLSSDIYPSLVKPRRRFLELTLDGNIVEEKPAKSLFGPRRRSVYEVLASIEKAREDPTIKGLLLKLTNPSFGLATVQELRSAILDFRGAGKTVICFAENMSNKEYYLASVCDEIVLMPAGYVWLTGLKSEVTFFKGTMDKLGMEAEIEAAGKYKSAREPVTRESMSEPFREVVNSLLDESYQQMTSAIAEGRGWSLERVREIVDEGPYTAPRAKETGLVDKLAYRDELREIIKEVTGRNYTRIGENDYRSGEEFVSSWAVPPKIAIIYATGTIVQGKSGSAFYFGKTIGSETIATAIRKAKEDRSVKAVVFRIDSPGGDGLASDVILREVNLCKKRKPFIVSMSDLAASGGYYIACSADTIVAQPSTLTGSIGVLGGKLVLREFYHKIGLRKDIITRGKRAAGTSDYTHLTEEERRLLKGMIDEFYWDFVRKVAEGRKLSEVYVDSVAQGRVWTGSQGKEVNLVDEVGGILLALQIAREKAGIDPEAEVEIVTLPEKGWRLGLGRAISPRLETIESLSDIVEGKLLFESDQILYLMPFGINIE
jgi:protease-4